MVSPDVILFGWLGSTHQLTHSSKLLVHFQANFIWWYIIISWSVLWKIGWLCSRSKSQQRFEMSTNVCPDDSSWAVQSFAVKLGMVVYYHELVCHEEKLVRCLQGQGYSKGLYNQNMTFFCIFWTGDPFAVEWKKRKGSLCSRSRSQWRLQMKKIQLFAMSSNC